MDAITFYEAEVRRLKQIIQDKEKQIKELEYRLSHSKED